MSVYNTHVVGFQYDVILFNTPSRFEIEVLFE